MQKLKIKNLQKNIFKNYKTILKNDSLKQKKNKLKQRLYESYILFQNTDYKIIEFNNQNFENLYLPNTVLNFNKLATIQMQYKNHFIFNYAYNYDLINNLNKILYPINLIKYDNSIRAFAISATRKRIYFGCLGLIIPMLPVDLTVHLHTYKKRVYLGKKKMKYFKNRKMFYKKIRPHPINIFRAYQLDHFFYKVCSNKFNNKKKISRLARIKHNKLTDKKEIRLQKALQSNITIKNKITLLNLLFNKYLNNNKQTTNKNNKFVNSFYLSNYKFYINLNNFDINYLINKNFNIINQNIDYKKKKDNSIEKKEIYKKNKKKLLCNL